MEDKKAWIYIHIFKAAGQFIKSRIAASKDTSKILDPFTTNTTYSVPLRHAPSISFVRSQIKLANDPRVGFVVVVRNPYDRLYSLWKWIRINGNIGNLFYPDVEERYGDFLINLKNGKYNSYYVMNKQTFFFTGEEDVSVKTMKFEELNSTVKTFFESNGVTWSYEKINETVGVPYREMYDPQTRDIVIERCYEEFEKFDYSLDL
jgi:hypothetical protein